ncbi:MAG: hypothetical protein JNM13_02445 [Hyphomicrobiaceae bacterium]|nr:hypothetical protein [Hyphomicrobiaceae bacterium]
MSRLATSFVLGYHGCDEAVGRRILNGDEDIVHSDKDYDWLGPGAYFWEADPVRALEWARQKAKSDPRVRPFVLGAVIDRGNCLDLLARHNLEILKGAYASFEQIRRQSRLEMPINLNARDDPNQDKLIRRLDCAVIRHLHQMIARKSSRDPAWRPFDTVRGMFVEGDDLYPGAGFKAKSHVQIAVVNPECMLGFFIPRPYPN